MYINGSMFLSDKETHTYFEDSIGMVSDWRKRGPVYEVPFRTLYSKKSRILLWQADVQVSQKKCGILCVLFHVVQLPVKLQVLRQR